VPAVETRSTAVRGGVPATSAIGANPCPGAVPSWSRSSSARLPASFSPESTRHQPFVLPARSRLSTRRHAPARSLILRIRTTNGSSVALSPGAEHPAAASSAPENCAHSISANLPPGRAGPAKALRRPRSRSSPLDDPGNHLLLSTTIKMVVLVVPVSAGVTGHSQIAHGVIDRPLSSMVRAADS
jgi:hypothetical protein